MKRANSSTQPQGYLNEGYFPSLIRSTIFIFLVNEEHLTPTISNYNEMSLEV